MPIFGVKASYNNSFFDFFKNQNKTNDTNESLFNIDGKINNFKQGITGDCWLLSTIEGLSNSKNGAEIIDNSITKNDDGSFDVEFKSINKKYNFNEDDIKKAKEKDCYSKGDDDVILLEMAFEKGLSDIQNGEVDEKLSYMKNYLGLTDNPNVLEGGNLYTAAFMLMDGDYEFEYSKDLDEACEYLNNSDKSCIVELGFNQDNNAVVKDTEGNDIYLAKDADHAWSLKSADDDTLTIVNPNDTERETTVYKKDIEEYLNSCNYVVFE